MSETKIVLIDFDGTICFDYFWRSMEDDIQQKIQSYLFHGEASLVNEWMRGKHTSEDINKKLSVALGYDYEGLWKAFVQDCKTMYIREETLKLISAVRQKFKTILLTDNMDCFDRFTVPHLGLHRYFDEIINSYSHGVTKGDQNGGLFRKIQMAGFEGAILIDNSQLNCQLFEAQGGKSHLVKSPKDVEAVLSKLI